MFYDTGKKIEYVEPRDYAQIAVFTEEELQCLARSQEHKWHVVK